MLFATWFVFIPWTFLSGEHGIRALLTSRDISRGRFGALLWRVFGVSFIIGVTALVFRFLFLLVGTIGGFLQIGFNIFIFLPILLASIFYLYEQAKAVPGAVSSNPKRLRKLYIASAIIGVVTLPFIFMMIAFQIALNIAIAQQRKVFDAVTPITTQVVTQNIQNASNMQGLKTYTNTKYGFSLQYPSDLSVSPLSTPPSAYKNILTKFEVVDAHYTAPPGATGSTVRSQLQRVSFIVYPYSNELLQTLQKQFKNAPTVSIANPTTSINAYIPQKSLVGPYFIAIVHNNTYIFTAIAVEHNALAEQILSTFRFVAGGNKGVIK